VARCSGCFKIGKKTPFFRKAAFIRPEEARTLSIMTIVTTHYRTLTPGSFVKICGALGVSFGLVYGVLNFLFILANTGAPYANMQTGSYAGSVVVGFIMIAVTPLIAGIMGALSAVILYLPFTYIYMPLQKGITISGEQK